MKLEKKLIAFSVVALIIGVSSVMPLLFLMTPSVKANVSLNEPWFNVSMPYAYWTCYDGPAEFPSDYPFEKPEFSNASYYVTYQSTMILNFTLEDLPTTDPYDARVEYYQIAISSDKEQIITINWFVGTYNSSSTFDTLDFLDNFHLKLYDKFDTVEFDKRTGEGNGLLKPDWTIGFSVIDPDCRTQSYGVTDPVVGQNLTTDIVSALREAELLSITIRRIGWVTFSGNTTVVTLANNEAVNQIQLNKFGDGFLYNTMIPEEELQTVDLRLPTEYY
ncbi:MAG: hypothetical protein WC325_06860 [Candidatus Bathyarchaeia archaeon]|jgi:hypothetical protein